MGTDYSGRRFGRLLVANRVGTRGRQPAWRCSCDCGVEVVVVSGSLKSGDTRSCGCLNKEILGNRRRTHGMTESPEYRTWCHMKGRCDNPTDDDYPNYGGRGIAVCQRWSDSFQAFLYDMGPRPTPHHTIERRDNDGPYSPDNCHWATRNEQNQNKRNVRRVTVDGETLTLNEWAQKKGFRSWRVIDSRLRYGWSAERSVNTPPR